MIMDKPIKELSDEQKKAVIYTIDHLSFNELKRLIQIATSAMSMFDFKHCVNCDRYTVKDYLCTHCGKDPDSKDTE